MRTLHGHRPSYTAGLRQVGDGVHAWLQPNGSWGETNAAVVTVGTRPVLVDCLWDERQTRRYLSEVDGDVLHSATLTHTHADGDHWWGNGVLPPSTPILTTERMAAEMATDSHPSRLAAAARLASSTTWLPGSAGRLSRYCAAMLAPFDFASVRPRLPTATYVSDVELDGVHLYDLGPAHTASDVVAHVPSAGVVLTGDLVFVGVTPIVWHGPLRATITALDRILALDADTYVPGHGPVCAAAEVKKLRAYYSWVAEAGGRELARGRSAANAARVLIDDRGFAPYRDWSCPERLVVTLTTLERERRGDGPLSRTPRTRLGLFAECAALNADIVRPHD